MCLNKIFSRPEPVMQSAPPPVRPAQQVDTTLPDDRPTVDRDETSKVKYGTSAKKSSPGAGKKRGAGQLRIPLNVGSPATGSQSGGANV